MNARGIETGAPQNALLAARIADRVAALGFDALDSAVVEKAKLCLIDYFASAFVTGTLPWGGQALELAARSPGDSPIVGTALRAARGEAVFANAVLGHGLVRDDMHVGSVSHLGAVVIPPALTVAGERRASGRELIAAIVAGYEAGGRLGRAILDVDVARIFRPTGIAGPVAGAVAAGRLAGLDAPGLANALALAANTIAGYNEWAATGGSEMFFQAGFAARNAVTAVALAASGARISPSALEGPAGLLAAFGKRDNAAVALPFTGEPEIAAVFFKEVPACNYAQTAAQAARALALSRTFDSDAIVSVTVGVPEAAAAYPGCNAPGPFEHVLQAKMSIQYNAAAALLRRSFDETNYVPSRNADVAALAARVVLEVDPALSARYPAAQGARVTVGLAGGETVTHAQDDVAAADAAVVAARFDAAASAAIGRRKAVQLHEAIAALDTLDDAGMLLGLARPEAASRTGG